MWQTTGQALLNERMRGEQDVPTLATQRHQQLCEYLDAQVGMLYMLEDDVLKLAGTYAYRRKNLSNQFQIGERLGRAGCAGKAGPSSSASRMTTSSVLALKCGRSDPQDIL